MTSGEENSRGPCNSLFDYETKTVKFRKEKEDRERAIINWHKEVVSPKRIMFCGIQLDLYPGVFSPSVGEGSALLAESIEDVKGKDVLEVGTGSGALAIIAAMKGANVLATDISDVAIKCARHNASMNELSGALEVRQGDVYSPLHDKEKFDVVMFNPPFMEGAAKDTIEASIYDSDYSVLRKFFEGLKHHLRDDGIALVAFSNVGSIKRLLEGIDNAGMACSIINIVGESIRFFVVELRLRKCVEEE